MVIWSINAAGHDMCLQVMLHPKNIKIQVIWLSTEIKSSGHEITANFDFLSNNLPVESIKTPGV